MRSKMYAKDSFYLVLMALPGILFTLCFKYIPLMGNIIVFQEYNLFKGFLHSQWVGFAHFIYMFQYDDFWKIMINSVRLGLYSVLFGFPAPLILALLLNEIRKVWFKKTVQTLLYLPYFLSWVMVGGIFFNILATKGIINQLFNMIGIGSIDFLTDSSTFIGTLISIGIWKEVGWGMIIYLAALTAINPSLYEAAMVDGAGRWRQMWHISLPSLIPAIVILLLLRIGHLLDANIEQMLIFINPLVRDVGEVFDTFIYRVGLLDAQYSYTAAIGIFKAIVGIILIYIVNSISKRATGESIY